MYTIVDIETTGGKYREEKIIEIALYKFDGEKVIDTFSTLVNPEKEIHFFVKKLTGITQKMVLQSPKFHEIAKRIIETCEGSTIVAHNAHFDYRMLRQEFKSLGYTFTSKTLDTIELSKELIPNLPSYSLKKLCKSLGIILLDAHRAYGDAQATLALFQLLLDKDQDKIIQLKSNYLPDISHKKEDISPKLLKLIQDLPNKTGVYYFFNIKNKIIYIGKSSNIKNRIRQHFTSTSKKSIKIQDLTERIHYEIMGSELIALVKESIEIRSLQPIFNRSQRNTVFTYGLYEKKQINSYTSLYISKINSNEEPILQFKNLIKAQNYLYRVTQSRQLCEKINKLIELNQHCFKYTFNECLGACINEENKVDYNNRVNDFLTSLSYTHPDLLFIDKGRNNNEKSFIRIEKGILVGYGFYVLNNQINTKEKLDKRMIIVHENQEIKHLVRNYLLKYPEKIINL